MQSTQFRCLILIGVLAVGGWLLTLIDGTRVADAAPRWPTDDGLYAVGDWITGPPVIEPRYGTQLVSRRYQRADGTQALLALWASPEAKRIYRAGPEVPFLGSGHAVDPAPPSLVPPAPGREAMTVRGDNNEAWLLLHTYGERRGLLGNGAFGWSMVALDATLGRPNDYYKAFVLAPLRSSAASDVQEVVLLADTLFGRLASWYAS